MNKDPSPQSAYSRFLNELHQKVLHGLAAHEDLDTAADLLLHHPDKVDAHQVLAILGDGGATWHESTVASFLSTPHDPLVAAMAIQVLVCVWSDPLRRYRDWVLQCIRGLHWDVEQDVRLMAISCAGIYCRRDGDGEVASSLIGIAIHDEDILFRETAAESLAIAMTEDRTAVYMSSTRRSDAVGWASSIANQARLRWPEAT